MKKVSGTLRLDLAQYRELQAFAAFGSDLDEATQNQLARGSRLVELLKQGQYSPMDVTEQIIGIYAGTKGYFDSVPVNKIRNAEKDLVEYISSKHSDLKERLVKEKALKPDIEKDLKEVIAKFMTEKKYS